MGVISSDIIRVDLAIQSEVVKAATFDTPLVVAKAPYVGVRRYAATGDGLAAMVTDGFATHSRAYQLVSQMAAIEGGVGSVFVYGRTTQHTQSLELSVDTTKTRVGTKLAFDITYHGTTSTISITVATNTVDAIIDLIEAAIDASAAGLAGITTTPDNATATKLTLAPGTAGDYVTIEGLPVGLTLREVGTDGSLSAQLTDALSTLFGGVPVASLVYGLLIDSFAQAEHVIAAAFALTNHVIFVADCPDTRLLDSAVTADTWSVVSALTNHYAQVYYTTHMTTGFAARLLSRQLAKEAGSSSWAIKTVEGAVGESLTSTQIATVRLKNGSVYVRDAQVNFSLTGRALSSRPFDITHGADFLKANLIATAFGVLQSNEKIPYNANGAALFDGAVSGELAAAERRSFVEPGWSVTVPDPRLATTAKKQARDFGPIQFKAVLTGAIESVAFEGRLVF